MFTYLVCISYAFYIYLLVYITYAHLILHVYFTIFNAYILFLFYIATTIICHGHNHCHGNHQHNHRVCHWQVTVTSSEWGSVLLESVWLGRWAGWREYEGSWGKQAGGKGEGLGRTDSEGQVGQVGRSGWRLDSIAVVLPPPYVLTTNLSRYRDHNSAVQIR